ncbi:MAG TPA: imidazole glycerol phosphate synthase subunit HisH [Caulobacteraceae bacterium]
MLTVALIDYGSGNLRSAEKALVGAARATSPSPRVLITSDPDIIANADWVVLPGVGAFAACMAAVGSLSGLIEAMTHATRLRGAPFLGICVGMQLMASRGLEFAETAGFGWMAGEVRRLAPAEPRFKVPHIGWNTLEGSLGTPLLAGLPQGAHMYFTHSYAFFPADQRDVAARTTHGETFAAAVRRDNLAGVQFHPEKSQATGATVLANFLAWRP